MSSELSNELHNPISASVRSNKNVAFGVDAG
jgi:hypothetical protein